MIPVTHMPSMMIGMNGDVNAGFGSSSGLTLGQIEKP